MKIKVLFVCLANICRSPMAEDMFKKYVKEHGLTEQFEFESRAISHITEGSMPHQKTLSILESEGVNLSTKIARQIKEQDFIDFDYIIGMDSMNIKYLKNFEDGYYAHKVFPLMTRRNVPDPYKSGNFKKTKKLITKSFNKWFEKWKEDISIKS